MNINIPCNSMQSIKCQEIKKETLDQEKHVEFPVSKHNEVAYLPNKNQVYYSKACLPEEEL
jgi:hypothetical protein